MLLLALVPQVRGRVREERKSLEDQLERLPRPTCEPSCKLWRLLWPRRHQAPSSRPRRPGWRLCGGHRRFRQLDRAARRQRNRGNHRCRDEGDAAGYSRLMGLDEVGTARALREDRKVTDALVSKHGGPSRALAAARTLRVRVLINTRSFSAGAAKRWRTKGQRLSRVLRPGRGPYGP